MKFLIAHPYKHHVFHLAAGFVRAGQDVSLFVPLYAKGVGRLVELLPGRVGRKMAGYSHASISSGIVNSSVGWQIRKLKAIAEGNSKSFVESYDAWVAGLVRSRAITPHVVVTLQDYMPATVEACAERGIWIHSDQISNQSESVQRRVRHHLSLMPFPSLDCHDESVNTAQIKIARSISVPSNYCRDGISDRVTPGQMVFQVPYGVDIKLFGGVRRDGADPRRVRILARANSVRKGGHLVVGALAALAPTISKISLEVRFLGEPTEDLRRLISKTALPSNVVLKGGNVAHSEVPTLLADSDLFLMPSLTESMSLACCEAMCAGVPVLLSKYCGVDIAEDGVTGLVFDDDVTSLANVLGRAIEERARWGSWGQEAADRARTLSWEAYEVRVADMSRQIRAAVNAG